jgi:RNA polymerase sigma-70 factor (ECF subfamily)
VNTRELDIIRLVAKGDSKSFDELFEMYYPRIYVLALSKLHDVSEAEDISQQTMVTVWLKLKTLKDPQAFAAWVTRIAINNCNAAIRRNKKGALGEVEAALAEIAETDEELLPEPYILRKDLKKRLGDTIDELREEQREAVILHYYSQLSVSEISLATGVNENTVKSRLSLARKYIKGRLKVEESRSEAHYYGVTGVALTSLGAAVCEHLAALEPDPEAILNARSIVAEKTGAQTSMPELTSNTSSEAGFDYLDDFINELDALSLIAVPMVPEGSLWPKMDDALFGDGTPTVEEYLQQLRNYKELMEVTEQRFALSARELRERILAGEHSASCGAMSVQHGKKPAGIG